MGSCIPESYIQWNTSPPDTQCWVEVMNGCRDNLSMAEYHCLAHEGFNLTSGMVDYLNLSSFNNYFNAYCEHPAASLRVVCDGAHRHKPELK
jgi:hypothetical protein